MQIRSASFTLVALASWLVAGAVPVLAADKAFEPISASAGKFPPGTDRVFSIASVPVSATAGGAPFATLSPTSEVRILGVDGEQLKVRVSGWQLESGKRLVFFAPGRRILVAQLKPDENRRLQRGQPQTDEVTEQVWVPVSFEGYVPRNQFVASVKPLFEYGEVLVNANCTSCHPRPDLDHFTANQWAGIVRSKKSRVSADAEQLAIITEYTQKHASDMAKK